MMRTSLLLCAAIALAAAQSSCSTANASETCSPPSNMYKASFLNRLSNLPLRKPQPTPPGLNERFENAGTPSKPRQRSGAQHRLHIVSALPTTDGAHRFARSCLIQGLAPENMHYDASPAAFAELVFGGGDVVFVAGDSANTIMTGDVVETLSKFRSQTETVMLPHQCSDCVPFGVVAYADVLQTFVKSKEINSWTDVLIALSSQGDVVTDDNKSIFSELTSHGDLYTGDVRYHQPFDDVDDLRVLDESTQTLPCFFHGTGAGIGQVDQIGNYIPNSWSDSKGCQACAEWMVEDQAVLPHIEVLLSVDAASPFLLQVLEDLAAQSYPKDKLSISVVIASGAKALVNRKIVADWISSVESLYEQVSILQTASYPEAVQTVVGAAHSISARMFLLHSHVRLTNTETLSMLASTDYNVIAPKLSREGKYWSNFWGGASGFDAIDLPLAFDVIKHDIGYLRSPDYFEIVERKQTGVWTVPLASMAVLYHPRVLDMLKEGVAAALPTTAQDPTVADWFNFQIGLCLHMRAHGVFARVSNQEVYGHLINADNYDGTHAHPDIYLVQENPIEWEARYLNELYDQYKELAFIPDCNDVYKVPLFSPTFAKEIIEECEFFGQWSGGDHADTRLDGGYEPVPTQDIHFQQLGFKKAWHHILKTYLRPITAHHYQGYHMEARHTLDFVVRYNPKKQSFLRPHHDASTVTLNVALNQGGVDYEGGGTHFLRQNCTHKDAAPGWGTLSPGRLTHLHEGLKTTKGTRYILVSFIDQM